MEVTGLIQHGAVNAARFLIQRGAADREDECISDACYMGYRDLIELLVDLYSALQTRRFDIADFLIEKGKLGPEVAAFLKERNLVTHCPFCHKRHLKKLFRSQGNRILSLS